MAVFLCYNTETGEIDHIRQSSNIANMQYALRPPGHDFIEVPATIEVEADYTTWYVDVAELEVKSRPSFGMSDRLEVAAGDGNSTVELPAGTTVQFDGTSEVSVDGLLEIDAEHVGSYTFQLSLFPYLPKTVEVIVSEASAP